MPGASLPPHADRNGGARTTFRAAQLPIRSTKCSESSHSLTVNFIRLSGWVVSLIVSGLILYYVAGYYAAGKNVVGSTPPALSLLMKNGAVTVAKPKGDDRIYQSNELPNGLKVVHVQDTRSTKSAYAVAVMAGSFDDPTDLPGLAHFCEHMLFLGTKNYPQASGFDDFMSANGGFNNAYTADETTVYYAEMSKNAGKEGMDRLADFFKNPLFDKKYVEKEVHAIDSEHAKNVQDLQRRVLQLIYSLANPKSPVGLFHTGDYKTLLEEPQKKGIDTVERLKEYFDRYYCPARMRLVTYGPEPIKEQLAEAKKKFGHFTANSSKCTGKEISFATPNPWGPGRMGFFVTMQGSLPQAQLWLHFPMPDVRKKSFRSQPFSYIEYVLNYRGVDSFSQTLQDNLGLVSSSQAMFDTSSAGTNMFVVMELTDVGQKQVELIMSVFFSYIGMLRQRGVDQELYESISKVAKLGWDWAALSGASDTASSIADAMTRLPTPYLLSGDSLIEKTDASLVQSLMEYIKPDNMNIIFVDPPEAKGTVDAPSFLRFDEQKSQTLPHYGVKYSTETINEVFLEAASRWDSLLNGSVKPKSIKSLVSTDTQIDLENSPSQLPIAPKAIEFVPDDIPLSNMHAQLGSTPDAKMFGARPIKMDVDAAKKDLGLLQDHENGISINEKSVAAWYRTGWVTTSPKVQLTMAFRVMNKDGFDHTSADRSIRLGVFSRLLSEAMVPKMVDLVATGVTYSIDVSTTGVTMSFGGFAPLLLSLVDKVVNEFNSFNGNSSATKPSRFKRVVQEIRNELGTYDEMPVNYAVTARNLLLQPDVFSRDESLKALDEITLDSALSSVNDILFSQPIKLTSLAMGNLPDETAKKAILQVAGSLRMSSNSGMTPKKVDIQDIITPVVKIEKPVEVRSKNPRVGDPNDVVVVSLIAGVSTVANRVVFALLGKILGTVAYNELRTSRQLGYVVNAGASQVSNVQYVSCIVQGIQLKADEVEGAVESVYTGLMPERLKNMTDKEFLSYKDALKQELMEPPTTTQDEVDHYWGPVAQGGKCFDLRSNMLQYLETMKNKNALVNQWSKLTAPSEGHRKKMVVKYFAKQVPDRPTEADAAELWRKQGVPDSGIALLRHEYQLARIFDKADSHTRQQLVNESGYYPRTLNCGKEEFTEEDASKKASTSQHFLKKRHSVLQP